MKRYCLNVWDGCMEEDDDGGYIDYADIPKIKADATREVEEAKYRIPSVAKYRVNTDHNEMVDFIMVENIRLEMLSKLAKKREEGLTGWDHARKCDNTFLIQMLKDHIDKGDMIDIMNIAAMIHTRNQMYGEPTVFEHSKSDN